MPAIFFFNIFVILQFHYAFVKAQRKKKSELAAVWYLREKQKMSSVISKRYLSGTLTAEENCIPSTTLVL